MQPWQLVTVLITPPKKGSHSGQGSPSQSSRRRRLRALEGPKDREHPGFLQQRLVALCWGRKASCTVLCLASQPTPHHQQFAVCSLQSASNPSSASGEESQGATSGPPSCVRKHRHIPLTRGESGGDSRVQAPCLFPRVPESCLAAGCFPRPSPKP
jgi:hypothetical protein